MNLQKRNCGMEVKLVPYGAGWTDVYSTYCRNIVMPFIAA